MCLYIANSSEEFVKELQKEGSPRIVYKVLVSNDEKLHSPYQSMNWTVGEIRCSDRRKETTLTSYEKFNRKVEKGLHFFTTKKRAVEAAHFRNDVVYKAVVEAEDIIAVSEDGELVAHKAKLLNKVYKNK